MKTIAPAAMAAIEAGEAIVTGAVEILPAATGGGVALCFALDRSGSMAGTRLATMKSAMATVLAVIRASVAAGAEIDLCVVAWSSTASTITRRIASETDVDDVIAFVNALAASGGTDFSVGMDGAEAFFTATDPGITDRFLFFVTDGAGSNVAAAAATLATMTDVQSYGINIVLTDITDTEQVDNTPADGVPVVSGDDPSGLVDAVTGALLEGGAIGYYGPIRVWGGYGPLEIGGNTFQGIGARGLAQQNGGALGGVAQGLTLSLSGVEAATLQLLDADEIKRAPTVLYRLIFASDGKSLLDAHVWDRGRVDTVSTDEEIGGDAAIRVAVESAARGLGRAGARRRSDSDQRLIEATDGYFKHAAFAGQKTLYWGGKKPSYGGAGTTTGGGGGSTGMFGRTL